MEKAELRLPSQERPLTPVDMLARKFPTDKFTPTKLFDLLYPSMHHIRDYTDRWSWHDNEEVGDDDITYPNIRKNEIRWLVQLSPQIQLLGIDALRLGTRMAVELENISLVPYIHFDERPFSPLSPPKLIKYGVNYTSLFIFRTSLFGDTVRFLETIK